MSVEHVKMLIVQGAASVRHCLPDDVVEQLTAKLVACGDAYSDHYVFTVGRNAAITRHRHDVCAAKRAAKRAVAEVREARERALFEELCGLVIRLANEPLPQLSPQRRRVALEVLLLNYTKVPGSEIACKLGLTRDNVYQLKHRALAGLLPHASADLAARLTKCCRM